MNKQTKLLVEKAVSKLPYSQTPDDFAADAVRKYIDVLKKQKVLKDI